MFGDALCDILDRHSPAGPRQSQATRESSDARSDYDHVLDPPTRRAHHHALQVNA
jgi:hypothetical protein